MTDGVTGLSLSARTKQKVSVATGCLCQTVFNWKLLHKFESCVNFHVEAEQSKWNCVKWDLNVISTTNYGCSVLSSSVQLWNMNSNNNNYYYYYIHSCPHHVGTWAKQDIIPTLVVDGGAWSESHPRHFTPLKVPHYPTWAGWTPETDWILQGRKEYPDLARIQTPDHSAKSLVTFLTTLHRLNTGS